MATQALCIRLDVETEKAIEAYGKTLNITNRSQIVRLLIAEALNVDNREVAFRRQALREGLLEGLALFKARMGKAMAKALEEIEGMV